MSDETPSLFAPNRKLSFFIRIQERIERMWMIKMFY